MQTLEIIQTPERKTEENTESLQDGSVSKNNAIDNNNDNVILKDNEFPEYSPSISSVSTSDSNQVHSDTENEFDAESKNKDNNNDNSSIAEEDDSTKQLLEELFQRKMDMKRLHPGRHTKRKEKTNNSGFPLVIDRTDLIETLNETDERKKERKKRENRIRVRSKIQTAHLKLKNDIAKESSNDIKEEDKENNSLPESNPGDAKKLIRKLEELRERRMLQSKERLLMSMSEETQRPRNTRSLAFGNEDKDCNSLHEEIINDCSSDWNSDCDFCQYEEQKVNVENENYKPEFEKFSDLWCKNMELVQDLNVFQHVVRDEAFEKNINDLDEIKAAHKQGDNILSMKKIRSQMFTLNQMAIQYIDQCNEILAHTIHTYGSELSVKELCILNHNLLKMKHLPELNFQFSFI